MSDVKQVKVDNWGIYFLQRLKHFFNRTDYCDLTLQFQDNAQLKVHRLVLSACTEYFELLERTCEMYEDCLVMPDDLQADIVVPIINYMYTGQLEFKMDLLEKLYQTSLIMNMPVLTKLLASHRSQQTQSNHQARPAPNNYYGKRYLKHSKAPPTPSSSTTNKRSFSNAFENVDSPKTKKPNAASRTDSHVKNGSQESGTSSPKFPIFSEKNKHLTKEPRPTRYELPEELDEDNIFDNSFTNISYTSKPLMVHPETTKQYTSKRIKLFEEGTSSRFMQSSNNDIVECKKISVNDSLFIDDNSIADENDTFHQTLHVKEDSKDASQLFDQIIDNNDCSNITIETKNNKQSGNLDHAKIISEVLKKYPHLVKSNKHIKLKILNTPNKSKKPRLSNMSNEDKDLKLKNDAPDFTYETDVIDSKEAARLIALGAENIRGPWICLICGTPGKALHFTSYYNFRKHLVDIHNEKPVPNICEYCGLKSQKRNYLVHHQLTKHGVDPPSHYNFPKCNYCKYIALNEALMVKHKLTHTEVRSFRRNVNTTAFTSNLMVDHTQKAGSKYPGERKHNLQCIYCLRVFLRENNLYAHLKTNHKGAAKNDGLIDDSDEDIQEEEEKQKSKHNSNESNYIKVELPVNYDNSFDDNNVQYQIERRADGNIHVVSKKQRVIMPITKHKILNPGFVMQQQNSPLVSKQQKAKSTINTTLKRNEYLQELCVSPTSNINTEEILLIDNNEYIAQDFQLIPKKEKSVGEFLMTNTVNTHKDESLQSIIPTTSMEYNIHNTSADTKVFVKKPTNPNQSIQIVVSNEEEYKALVSNQSVIFEDGDSNKALTVLAPGGSSLETATIDLDNVQSNDMMIIQDDFSINVSEAVAANNSNIVVVYSHPVEDQNKQYQIITTQAVEAQFVPSSAIITQNYETVTTCTPVVSANTALNNSWQNNIETNVDKLPIAQTSTESELHNMTVAESVTIAPESDSNSNINEFSEVPITTAETTPIIINEIVESHTQTIENTFNESNVTEGNINVPVCQPSSIITLEHPNIITDGLQQIMTETNIQPLTSTSLDESAPLSTFITTIEEPMATNIIEPITETTDQVTSSELSQVYGEEILQQEHQVSLVDSQNAIKSTPETNTGNESIIENIINEVDSSIPHSSDGQIGIEHSTNKPREEEPSVKSEKLEEPVIDTAVEETIENITRHVNLTTNTIEKPELPKDAEILKENPVTKVAIAQIENLASEWSEDESDTLTEGENKIDKPTLESKNGDTSEISSIEESIENIKQAIENGSANIVVYTGEVISSPQDVNLSKLPDLEKDKVSNDTQAQASSKEKISLLLNDWDDNDSQEESTPATCEPKTNDTDSKLQNNEINAENDNVKEKSELCKNDNIKSLVSDWDEDDEENKE